MNQGAYVFSQIMEQFPRHDFDTCVKRYEGEKYVKSFSSRDQFLAIDLFGNNSPDTLLPPFNTFNLHS